MKDEIKKYTEKIFEDIKHIDNSGNEYWYARELQFILKYTQWRRFQNVIRKAKLSCKNSNINVEDHFADVGKMVDIGSNTKRDNVDNEYAANFIHYEVGKEVRNTIKRLGGTMPENLQTTNKSLKEIEKENQIE